MIKAWLYLESVFRGVGYSAGYEKAKKEKPQRQRIVWPFNTERQISLKHDRSEDRRKKRDRGRPR